MTTNIIMRRTLLLSIICIVLCYGCYIPMTKNVWNDGNEIKYLRLIDENLKKGNKVSIIFLPGDIQIQSIKEGITKNDMLNGVIMDTQRGLIKRFGDREGFSVVNRTNLNSDILQEMSLSGSGLISEDTRIKLGQLTGATHLIVISVFQNSNLGYNTWTIDIVFTDIQTGRVLSIDECSQSVLNII